MIASCRPSICPDVAVSWRVATGPTGSESDKKISNERLRRPARVRSTHKTDEPDWLAMAVVRCGSRKSCLLCIAIAKNEFVTLYAPI
jgi:hypothetical protein